MNRPSGRKILASKWVVPLSAMVLTLAIVSFALAGTAVDGGGATSSASSWSPAATTPAPTTTSTMPAGLSFLLNGSSAATAYTAAGATGAAGAANGAATADAAAASAALQLELAKENAILDLIREKMTVDDQLVFDRLRAVASQQQVALNQTQADLEATKAQISALIDKYLGGLGGLTAPPTATLAP